MRYRVIALVCVMLVSCLYVRAAVERDSVRVYFRDGSSGLDFSLHGNGEALDGFVARSLSLSADTACRVFYLRIAGHASPSGTAMFNKKLSEERAAVLLDYLRSRISFPDSSVRIVADGVDWDGLAAAVEKDTAWVEGETVLRILRHTPQGGYDAVGRMVDGRKKKLMDLQGGRVYRLLGERYFDGLRNVFIEIGYERREAVKAEPVPLRDAAAVMEYRVSESIAEKPAVQDAGLVGLPLPDDKPLHRLAVKTNLVYDALLMPSLEVEYRINGRWTVNIEGDMAWWKNDGRHKYYQLATVSPEGRYWFKTRKPWHGHYAGLFGGFSWYDLENGRRGYKGEALMAGLSYGYMFPVNRSLSFEAGVGVGFMHSWYEEYLPVDGHYVYQQSSKLDYFGPLKLKFALVWRLWDLNRKKGGDR